VRVPDTWAAAGVGSDPTQFAGVFQPVELGVLHVGAGLGFDPEGSTVTVTLLDVTWLWPGSIPPTQVVELFIRTLYRWYVPGCAKASDVVQLLGPVSVIGYGA
jgi:hypothetical protein